MGKIAFLFSGQGAQYVGMGKEMIDNFEVSAKIFEKADAHLPFELTRYCLEGPQEKLNRTEITQPAILTTSMAILKVIEEKGIRPDVVAGLSLGEYSALVCAGALGFEEAVKLVHKRGQFMQEAVPEGVGTMAAIMGLSGDTVKEICVTSKEEGIVEPANFNCPGQVVIGGEISSVKKACVLALEKGAKRAIELSVSAPFHTSMLEAAKENLEKALENIEVKPLKIPLITNVTADYITDEKNIKNLLADQVVSPVLWEDSIRRMIEDGVDTFIEIGPGKVLSGFVKKINRKLNIYHIENIKSLENTLGQLGGIVC